MKRLLPILIATCLCLLGIGAPAAQASFGLPGFDVAFTNKDGTPATEAGSHPFAMTISLGSNFIGEGHDAVTEGRLKDFFLEQVPGLVGDTTAYPRCTNAQFLEVNGEVNNCPLNTAVGITASSVNEPGAWFADPVFNLTPPPGVLLRLGFRVGNQENIVVDVGVKDEAPSNPIAAVRNTPEILYIFGNKTQLWGDPSDPEHDGLRGECGTSLVHLPPGDIEDYEFKSERGEICHIAPNPKPFLTLPTNCSGPLRTSYEAFSWEGEEDRGFSETHEGAGNPQPFTGCESLGFKPSISAKPTTKAAQSPTGLDFSLDVEDEGLTSVSGRAQSEIKKAVVTLPEGMTANPSLAEGLEVCTLADLKAETLDAAPGEGCPEASKIGTLEVETPLVEEPVKGSLYQAKPYENEFNSLIALYIVIKNPKLGIIVKQAANVQPDPKTGQLITTTDNIPQLPFSHFKLHFREGGRSPLISPPHCGTYKAKAELTPWSGSAPVSEESAFTIVSGPNEGPCPPGGVAPFHPEFEAGSVNNAAGKYSPFDMRLTRKDGEQDMTKLSTILPPGVIGKLAGVSKCPQSAVAIARSNTGLEERANPSCPSNSKIGTTIGGAGVGSQLTFVGGSIYLGGPFHGDPLSVIVIVPAVAGPFDAGTVVVQVALNINPETAEVEADGAHSDPIPTILKGIPLNVRDLRVNVDRPDFILNPTSCRESSARATLFGSYLNPLDPADDVPVSLSTRYQAASCASLGFKPSLTLRLKGGTKRGSHPSLRAELKARPGDANIGAAVVTLPRSAFLDQGHIRTICTRVQFAAKACPPGAVYGQVRAFTPLLDETLEGPVYLRSSNHKLPDLVAALHGIVDVNVVGRIDSHKGGIRTSFETVPDAPVTRFVLTMQGGKKGLVVNSRNLCTAKNRAEVRFTGQNGKLDDFNPVVQASCGKKK
jgi:hypothetical protein